MTEVVAVDSFSPVTLTTSARQPRHTVGRQIGLLICVGVVVLVALAGCGGSSKPAYCSVRSSVQNTIKDIESLSPTSGLGALESAYTKVKTNANTVVSEAKNDFPTETSAIQSSVSSLTSAVSSLRSNPSAGNIAAVAGAAGNVVSSFQSFLNATKSKCS